MPLDPRAAPTIRGETADARVAPGAWVAEPLHVATATPTGSSAVGTMVMAMQVKGVPADKLLAWSMKGSGDMPQTTIGGKQVYGAAAAGFGAYLYVKNDAIYYVLSMGGGASMAEGILSQLP